MSGVISCSSHTYAVRDRSGGIVTAAGTLTSVEWNRLLNDASQAKVEIGVSGPTCCAELGAVRSWRHSLELYRGGEFVWAGPIVSVEWSRDSVAIEATDIIGLLDRRVAHADYTFTDTDITEIAEVLIEDGLAPDDPGHTVTVKGLADVIGGREYEKDVGQTADHLRDLADTGLDFVAVGNNIVILPDDFCEVVGRLADEDFPEGLSVAEDGASLATRVIVAGSDDSDVVGAAGGVNAYYGLIERYFEQTSITTQAAADSAAAAALKSLAVAPVFVETSNVTLAPTAPVSIPDLVPGWCVDVTSDATCRVVSQRLKITGIKVTEDGGSAGNAGQESIVLQLTATGNQLEVI